MKIESLTLISVSCIGLAILGFVFDFIIQSKEIKPEFSIGAVSVLCLIVASIVEIIKKRLQKLEEKLNDISKLKNENG